MNAPPTASDAQRRLWLRYAGWGLLGALAPPWATANTAQDSFWQLLREGGCIVLMRHALTEPGVGDPPGFRLDDCRTQRNLSAAGREQSRRVREAFEAAGIRVGDVRSSAWCRCTETADLAFGRHEVWAPLNSFFGRDGGQAQTRQAMQALAGWRGPDNLILVTHQVNITALTGQSPAMGQLFLSRPDGGERLPVLARLTV
jgi:phosphohistidine phosphatase SixA